MTEKKSIDDFSVRLNTCLSYLSMLGHTESLSSQKEEFMTGVRYHPKGKYETLALISPAATMTGWTLTNSSDPESPSVTEEKQTEKVVASSNNDKSFAPQSQPSGNVLTGRVWR